MREELQSGKRPRVVVESSDAAWAWAAEGLLERAGYEVVCCGGPRSFRKGKCPLVTEGRCQLVEGADVVLNALGVSEPAERSVLVALREQCPEVAVVAEIAAKDRDKAASELDGCRVLNLPVYPEQLIAAVRDAARSVAV